MVEAMRFTVAPLSSVFGESTFISVMLLYNGPIGEYDSLSAPKLVGDVDGSHETPRRCSRLDK